MGINKIIESNREKSKLSEAAEKTDDKHLITAVRDFERDREAAQQEKIKVWRIAAVIGWSGVICLSIAMAVMMPLKTIEPLVIRVDSLTGYTDMVRPLSDKPESFTDVEKKSDLARFVLSYESYSWESIKNSYEMVKLMSSKGVFSQYNVSVRADNSPLNVLKDQYSIKVVVMAINMLKPDFAMVRFKKTVVDSTGQPVVGYKPTTWIASVTFDYGKEIKTEGERWFNSKGFMVTSYNVDPEAIK